MQENERCSEWIEDENMTVERRLEGVSKDQIMENFADASGKDFGLCLKEWDASSLARWLPRIG